MSAQMKLRCDLHVNGASRKLVLVPGENEKDETLALKLAAYLLFWGQDPVVDASARHPALAGQEFLPDLMALDETGAVRLWVECGSATLHKLMKLTRRLPQARIVVLKATEREARRLRSDMEDKLDRHAKVEVLAWRGDSFRDWLGALAEKTEVYGEAGGLSLNVVVNERPLAAELARF